MKSVLITGANRGIGLALAKTYKEKGYKVLATARKPADATELSQVADKVIQLDVGSEADISALPSKLSENESIDLLINNAGVMERMTLETLATASAVHQFTVNSLGPILVSRALLPALRKAPAPRIVNITSRMGSIGDNGSGGHYPYRASKAALNIMTKSWSVDIPDVPVMAAHPGFIRTDMVGNHPGADMSPEDCALKLFTLFDEFQKDPAECKYKTGCFVHRDGDILPW